MQIIENQMIYLENLLSYKAKVEENQLVKMIKFFIDNASSLGIYVKSKIIVNVCSENFIDGKKFLNAEILIPVSQPLESTEQFEYKPKFKLVNAVKIRHEGKIQNLFKSKKFLENYIKTTKLQPVTNYYDVFVRSDCNHDEDNIIDIYVGINENVI